MRTRLELHNKLCDILGSKNVYYTPPSKGMKYPAIKYDMDNINGLHADDILYKSSKRWIITIIDENPDSIIPEKLLNSIRYCSFDRTYTSDDLYHFVFTLYF